MVLFALARCWMQRRGGSCRTRCGGTRPSPHSRAFLVSLVQSSSQTRCHAIIAASITEAEPFRAGVQESVRCERIGHLTVMQALLHTRRWHSRRVCKPMRIVRQPAGRPQRGRRQSASQQQQQATTCLHDNILHALLSLAQHPSLTGCPTRFHNLAYIQQAVQQWLLGVQQRRRQVARAGRAPRPRTAAASQQPRDKVSMAWSGRQSD